MSRMRRRLNTLAPSCVQVFPPSVLLYTPAGCPPDSAPALRLPVAAKTMFVFTGLMATSEMASDGTGMGWPPPCGVRVVKVSQTGVALVALLVLQTPPLTVATKAMLALVG